MSNPWVTEADAEAYFATRLGASEYWASGTDREAALTTAYNDLAGCGLFDFELPSGEEIPNAWAVALCEQALFLLMDEGIDARAGLISQGVSQAGIVKESYNRLTAHTSPGGIVIAPKARALLADYLSETAAEEAASTGTFPVER